MVEEETIRIEVSAEEVDKTIAKIEGAASKQKKIEDIGASAAEARETGDEVIGQEDKIKGLNMTTRRIMRQIPGLREANRLLSLIRLQMRIAPAVFALLLAWQTLRTLSGWLTDREREAKEYRRMIMEARGLGVKEAQAYIDDERKRTTEAYMSSVIP